MFEKEIRAMLLERGAAIVGFCKLDFTPVKELNDHIYCVSICVKLSDSVLKTITDRPSISYFQHYRTVNARLDQLALDTVNFIEEKGYGAFPIAASQSVPGNPYSGIFQHKTAARLSGVGYIGKNDLLITERFGSKVRLATVLTNMPLERDMPILSCGCGSCKACFNACPVGAISGEDFNEEQRKEPLIDTEKCSLHMKTYKDVGRGSVCGLCIKACPKNKLF